MPTGVSIIERGLVADSSLKIRSPAMPSVISAALAYFASWCQARHAMQLEILALRPQLAVYQHSVRRPQFQPADRLLGAWLSRLWSGWQHTLEFVQPRTVIAWQKKRFRDYWRRLSQSGKPGRPAIARAVRELIQDMWCSNPTWGSPRIVGELRKLGIDVTKSCAMCNSWRDTPACKPPSAILRVTPMPSVNWCIWCDHIRNGHSATVCGRSGMSPGAGSVAGVRVAQSDAGIGSASVLSAELKAGGKGPLLLLVYSCNNAATM